MTLFYKDNVKTRVLPAQEPVTLERIKDALKVDGTDEDDVLRALIHTAREVAEGFTGRSLINQELSLFLDAWPMGADMPWWDGVRDMPPNATGIMAVELPRAPVQTVDAVLVYAEDGTSAVFDDTNYYLDSVSNPPRLVLKQGVSPPVAARQANGIEIRYTAGFGATAAYVPAPIVTAIIRMVAYMFEHRGDEVPDALNAGQVMALLKPYQTLRI